MNADEKEKRLNEIWKLGPSLEKDGKCTEALELWREALTLKEHLGVTGAGDVGELNGIKANIDRLLGKTK